MSSQPSQLPELPTLPKLPEFKKQQPKSVLDEPWRVTMLPDDEVPTIAVPSPDAAPASKSLPWKRGDVARLRDDSPEGMMRYIATHSNGWWQELAERALRDTDKARRMAEEAGWQPGQYWTLEPDAEAREKLAAQEEARRQREEQECAREQAEKEAFAARQMELLKKAGRAPRCEYLYTDGRSCRAPQVRGERWCHGHAKMMSYRPEKLELLPMEDEQAVTVNLYRVTRSLLSGRITTKVAGLALWSVAIASPYVKRKNKIHHGGAETRREAKKGLPQMNADGRRSERRSSRESTRKKALKDRVIARDPVIAHDRKSKNNSGVTKRKSFRSGVGRGGRVLPEMPAMPKIAKNENPHSSVSPCLRGEVNDRTMRISDHRDIPASEKQDLQTSASPRLRGENIAGRQNCVFPRGRIVL